MAVLIDRVLDHPRVGNVVHETDEGVSVMWRKGYITFVSWAKIERGEYELKETPKRT